MNKQEMAEWLAVKVLGWKSIPADDDYELDLWHSPNREPGLTTHNLIEYIFSPVGFFAVWDAVEGDKCVGMEMYIPPDEELRGESYSCTIMTINQETIIKCGKDRYEAFYKAVHEVMK